jgi:large subunit ribosomal protein L23
MRQEQLMKVIQSPHMSEKAAIAKDANRVYVFHVLKTATKSDIKEAVKLMFKTEVEEVRIVNVKPKPKRFGQIQGKSKAWKKAYVKLQAGHEIEFAGKQ